MSLASRDMDSETPITVTSNYSNHFKRLLCIWVEDVSVDGSSKSQYDDDEFYNSFAPFFHGSFGSTTCILIFYLYFDIFKRSPMSVYFHEVSSNSFVILTSSNSFRGANFNTVSSLNSSIRETSAQLRRRYDSALQARARIPA
jgi:hypothetical protein